MKDLQKALIKKTKILVNLVLKILFIMMKKYRILL